MSLAEPVQGLVEGGRDLAIQEAGFMQVEKSTLCGCASLTSGIPEVWLSSCLAVIGPGGLSAAGTPEECVTAVGPTCGGLRPAGYLLPRGLFSNHRGGGVASTLKPLV
jgi:hypothetical protein